MAALFPRANFLDVLDGNPDLYGPFWIATTVVVILFLTGSISRFLAMRNIGSTHYGYDFKLLSGALGLIYGYTSMCSREIRHLQLVDFTYQASFPLRSGQH